MTAPARLTEAQTSVLRHIADNPGIGKWHMGAADRRRVVRLLEIGMVEMGKSGLLQVTEAGRHALKGDAE